MTERNLRRSALIGIVVTVGGMVAAWLVGGARIFADPYTVTAEFAHASNIGSGDPVRVAGIDVGTVSAVERLPQSVRVTLELNEGVEISKEVGASIRLRTMLGKKFVLLSDPGVGPVLESGDVIPMERTDPAVDLDQVVNSFDTAIEETNVEALNALLQNFDRAIAGKGDDIGELLGDFEHLITTVAQRQDDIDRLIVAGETLIGAVADRKEALSTSMSGLATALDALAARRAELSALVEGVHGLTQKLTPLIERNEGNLDAIITGLVETSRVLDARRDRLDLALDQLPDATYALVKVTRQGSWINVYNVGFPMSPYLGHPMDPGDAHGQEPQSSGGLPRVWLRPPTQTPEASVAGVNVDTEDHQPPPPEGFYDRPEGNG